MAGDPMSGPDRHPNPYTSGKFRAEYPGLTPGDVCPSCEEKDSISASGVCFFCVCGCSYCEP